MIAIDEFLTSVLPDVPGCPESLASEMVLEAAITLCKRSRVLKEALDPIDVVAAQRDYTLSTYGDTVVIEPVSVLYDSVRLDAVQEAILDDMAPTWRLSDGPFGYYTVLNPGTLTLAFSPSVGVTGGLRVTVSVRPSNQSVALPDVLYNEYSGTIADGAKALLMVIPGKAWSNPALGDYYDGKFYRDVQDIKMQGMRSFSNAVTVTRMRPFA